MPWCHIMPSFPVLNSLQRYPKAIQLPFIMVELNAAGHFLEATEERMLVRKMASPKGWGRQTGNHRKMLEHDDFLLSMDWFSRENSQENPIFNGKSFGFLKVFPTEPIHRYRLTNGNLTSSEPKTSHFAFIPKKESFSASFLKIWVLFLKTI